MSFSDEILQKPELFAAVRDVLAAVALDTGARSVFLVDEKGTPFAARGAMEFPYPHPLSRLAGESGGASLLEALVGTATPDRTGGDAPLVVVRASSRALLALIFDHRLEADDRARILARVRTLVERLGSLLEGVRAVH